MEFSCGRMYCSIKVSLYLHLSIALFLQLARFPHARIGYSPFGFCCTIPLPPIFEPVANLRGRKPGLFRKLSLFAGGRIWVLRVPLAQDDTRLLLEAIARLLAVPNGTGQRELATNAVLSHGSQGFGTNPLGLDVVSLQPQLLHLWV